MATGSISLKNIQNVIELFNKDLIQCNRTFSEIEDDFILLKCEHQRQKSEIKDSVTDIHSDLLRNLKKIDNLNLEENFHIENYEAKLNQFNNVLQTFKKIFNDTVTESKVYKEIFLKNYKGLKETIKDIPVTKEAMIYPNKVHLNVLRSRQTDNAFIIMKLKSGYRKCNGCNDLIQMQSLYLSHIEEYPSGSKSFKPHAYHIKQECLFRRGFEIEYLNKIPVTSNLAVDKDLNNILADIGFQIKNIFLTNSHINDSDSDNDFDKVRNSDNDYPDNVSEASDVSSVPSIVTPNIPVYKFLYHRKPVSQKKVITCQGCQTNIETETYISLEANSTSVPFHIQKNCLKTGGVLLENFSRTKCVVYKLLNTHNDLKELLACGFYFNKILGFRPQNPIYQKQSTKSSHKQIKHDQNNDTNLKTSIFIFNEEPFYYDRLIHGEKCRGCNNLISKNEMSLRHQERVPRENKDISPLTSQYYHVNKECLLKRGFTFKYLSFIQCKAILSGEDNLMRVTESLIHSGFYNENIIYSPKEKNEPRGFEIATESSRDVLENKLYIVNCTKSSTDCKGCGFILMPNQPCFMFSLSPEQNSNAKYFHIKSNCLKVHFTKEQIMATVCITNNLVDVSPNDIINCGIVKIVTEPVGWTAGNITSQPNRPRTAKPIQRRPVKKPPPNTVFYVLIVPHSSLSCGVCNRIIPTDRCSLKIQNRPPNQAMIHLDPDCVAKLGMNPDEIANSELVFCGDIPPTALTRLRRCGFKKFPKY